MITIRIGNEIESAFDHANYLTYNLFENIDFVEQHALLVVVHVTLAEHLDSTLGARLSMHAHTHLSKGPFFHQNAYHN